MAAPNKTPNEEKPKNSIFARLQSKQSKRTVLPTPTPTSKTDNTNERLINKFSRHLTPEEIEKFRGELMQAREDSEKKCKLIYECLRTYLEAKDSWDETKRRHMTNKALAFLSEFRDHYDINYQYKPKNFTLLHKAVQTKNATFVRFILFLFKNVDIDLKTSAKDGSKTALDFAMYNQNTDIIAALEAFKTSTDESRDVRDFCMTYEVLLSKSEIFMQELKKVLNNDETKFDAYMSTLSTVMKRLVHERKPLSSDMLFLATNYEETRERKKEAITKKIEIYEESKDPSKDTRKVDEMPMYQVLASKLEDVLDVETLSRSDGNFYWFRQNFMKNPLWLITRPVISKKPPATTTTTNSTTNSAGTVIRVSMYKHLFRMIREQTRKDTSKVRDAMRALIESDKEAYKKVLKFHYKKDKYKKKAQQRQDEVDDGVRAGVKEYQLVMISLFSSDAFFNATQLYDLDTYLSNLVIRAHILDKPFQDTMLSIYHDDPTCDLFFGPVKTLKRCKEKAQLDYHSFPFPSCAQVIDMVRCSLTYNNFSAMLVGLKKLMDYCDECAPTLTELTDLSELARSASLERDRSAQEKFVTKVKIEIMRCKNTFTDLILPKKPKPGAAPVKAEEINIDDLVIPEELPVPGGYRDIKLNVIVTMFEDGVEPMSIVGEIQFLLKTMLATKLKRHDLYEIQRIKEFYDKAKERSDYATLVHQLRVAGTNSSLLTPLLVNFPQKFSKELIDETERTDAYGESYILRILRSPTLKPDSLRHVLKYINPQHLAGLLLVRDRENWTPLHIVCRYQTKENIRVFCEFLPKPQHTYWNHLTDEEGFSKTPLMIGCENSNKGSFEAILQSLPTDTAAEKLWTAVSAYGNNSFADALFFQEDISPLFKYMPASLLKSPEYWKETREGEDGSNVFHLVLANEEHSIAVRTTKLKTLLKYIPSDDLAAQFVEQQNKEAVSPATMCKMMDSLRKNAESNEIESILTGIIQKKREAETLRRKQEEERKQEEDRRKKEREERERAEMREMKRMEYMTETLQLMSLGFEDMEEILTVLITHNGNVDAASSELFQRHFG